MKKYIFAIAILFALSASTTALAAPSVQVASPKGGNTFEAGQTYTIHWTGAGAETARVLLYKGNQFISGKNAIGSVYYQNGIAALDVKVPFVNGSYVWTIPKSIPAGNDYRIGIMSHDSGGADFVFDQSDVPFSIVASTQAPTITHITPTSGIAGSHMSIYGSNLDKATSAIFSNVNAPKGATKYTAKSFKGDKNGIGFNLPTNIPQSTYSVGVSVSSGKIYYAQDKFVVTGQATPTPTISSVNPTFGPAGSHVTIKGSNFDKASAIIFTDINKKGGIDYTFYSMKGDANNVGINLYSSMPQGTYSVGFRDLNGKFYSSNHKFTIVEPSTQVPTPSVTITAPASGAVWTAGRTYKISWSGTVPAPNTTSLSLVSDKGFGRHTILNISPTIGAKNYHYWTIPTNIQEQGPFKIVMSGKAFSAESNYFPIAQSNQIITPALQPTSATYQTPPITTTPPKGEFTRNLWRGLRGSDVKKIQEILNRDPSTRIAEFGIGSPGQETDYYGFLTQSAIQNFQCKYGIVCSGSSDSTGYGVVGPSTRVKLNTLYGGDSVPQTTTTSSSYTNTTSVRQNTYTAQAPALTSPQTDAIINLLSAFGADQATIDNVRAALGR